MICLNFGGSFIPDLEGIFLSVDDFVPLVPGSNTIKNGMDPSNPTLSHPVLSTEPNTP
jgi:hypothetical protein